LQIAKLEKFFEKQTTTKHFSRNFRIPTTPDTFFVILKNSFSLFSLINKDEMFEDVRLDSKLDGIMRNNTTLVRNRKGTPTNFASFPAVFQREKKLFPPSWTPS